jgi:ubiquitin carboxyl-terminal hydrolase L5
MPQLVLEANIALKSEEINDNQIMPSEAVVMSFNDAASAGKEEQTSLAKSHVGQISLPEASPPPDSPSSKKRAPPEPSPDEEPSTKRAKELSSVSVTSNTNSTSPKSCPNIDKETWQGFCDIESEPAYFSVILRDMGVQDVTVREVFGMTPDLLDMLPQPIYGLILLFRYREFGNEDQTADCPSDVWFANQLPAQNSCGTLAMINILMNNADVNVGEHLAQFKEFTRDMTPFQRGEAFASFDFVKNIHNSFAKKMDLLENDKYLSYKVKKRAQVQAKPKPKPKHKPTSTSRSRRRNSEDSVASNNSAESFEANAHHFIAFVPVGTQIYKLDGMDAQPTLVGSFDPKACETWLEAASDTIATLMAAGDDDYGIVALTQSPLSSLRRNASLTINTLVHVDSRLDGLSQTWRDLINDTPELTNPHLLGLEAHLPLYPIPANTKTQIDTELLPDLLHRRGGLAHVLDRLAAKVMEEVALEAAEEEKVAQRRFDTGPAIKVWLEMLAGNGWLEENLKRFM